jgi:hypothetical protein
MAEVKFPASSAITLTSVGPDDLIRLCDFGGVQSEREGKYRLAVAYKLLHKRKQLEDIDYDPADPAGAESGVRVTADEYRQATDNLEQIPIPLDETEPFVSKHLIISTPSIAGVADEENPYFRNLLSQAKSFITG